jgi:hypothetical protein
MRTVEDRFTECRYVDVTAIYQGQPAAQKV